MNRHQIVTRYITKEAKGIEIGAFHSGVVPKRDGYNSRILDVFDTETLRERAHAAPNIPPELESRIEPVDYVGSSTDIERLVGAEMGSFDYIVSSHNIEHSPDPITFFQGCSNVLKPGGMLSMIVPDRRGCYDYFRPNSATAALIDAYFSKRGRPTYAQVFEHQSLASRVLVGEEIHFTFAHGVDPNTVIPFRQLQLYFDKWQKASAEHDETYVDAHCWTFTPATFELILRDLSFFKLVGLEIIDIEPSEGEFFVHLRNSPSKSVGEDEFYRKRNELLLRASDEASTTSPRVRQIESDLASMWSREQETASRIQALEAERDRLRQEIVALRQSTSWKLTAALRSIATFTRRSSSAPHR